MGQQGGRTLFTRFDHEVIFEFREDLRIFVARHGFPIAAQTYVEGVRRGIEQENADGLGAVPG